MIGYILTETEKNAIQGKEFAPYEYFNCVQDINGVWFNFVTEQQKPLVQASQYAWVLNCPEGEFVPPPSPDPFNGQS